jgi:hypothetical protein
MIVPTVKSKPYSIRTGGNCSTGVLAMTNQPTLPKTEWYDLAEIDAALKVAFRNLMLEHARLGRSVHQSRDGKIVEVTPAELFARYGLDENGKPLPATPTTTSTQPESASIR